MDIAWLISVFDFSVGPGISFKAKNFSGWILSSVIVSPELFGGSTSRSQQPAHSVKIGQESTSIGIKDACNSYSEKHGWSWGYQ
jgi:hypothetical protein